MRQGKAVTDFFISYTSVDGSWAEWMAWVLEEAEYTTIVQAWDFGAGANFVQEMDAAAKNAERTIAVLSPDYLQSSFTPSRWHAAFRRDPTGTQRLLIPVRVRECDVDGLLGGIVYIDLVGLDAEAARERLLRACCGSARSRPGNLDSLAIAPTLLRRHPFSRLYPHNIPLLGDTLIVRRDIIVHLARIASASKFSGKIEAFLEEYLVTETGPRTVPFGGRDEDVALLDVWLDNENAPPRYLLTAPAGRGKSALLVRWLQHLQEQGRVGRDAPASWQLVFVPISIWLETHRLDIFYEALAAGMAEILGEELPPTHTDKGIYYADHCRTLASAAVAKGRRILIVLDGIDEALGEPSTPDGSHATRGPSCDSCFRPAGRLAIWALRAGKHGLDGSGTCVCSLGSCRSLPAKAYEIFSARWGRRPMCWRRGRTSLIAYTLWPKASPWCCGTTPRISGLGGGRAALTIDDLAQMRPGLSAYFAR